MNPAPDAVAAGRAALERLVIDVPDFPQPGIVFKDITPALADPEGLRLVVDALAAPWQGKGITHVVGIESRGFLFASPVAMALGAGVTLVRKPGKLPRATRSVSYALEYGTDTLEIHADALGPDAVALIIDDVLATGGTASATGELVSGTGASLVGYAFALELDFLQGRTRLADSAVASLLHIG
jgi:adenine phosphoribosyltransferase